MKKRFKQGKSIFLILLIFFLIKIFVLFKLDLIRWDEAVYIETGKYIFSFGKSGFFEASRPLILPILQGFLWFIGLSPVIFGKILTLFFSIGYIYFSYLIAKELFSEKVAVISSIMIMFSPIFFFFSSFAMTGIIATFFILVGFYSLIKKKYFLSGLFFSLGFMTRFLVLFAVVSVIIIFLFKPKIRNIVKFSLGFFIFFIPYLILNYFLYGNFVYPFVLQSVMTSITGLGFHKAWWYYFFWAFKENFLIYLSIIAIFLIFKQRNSTHLMMSGPSGIRCARKPPVIRGIPSVKNHSISCMLNNMPPVSDRWFLTQRKVERLSLISIAAVFFVFYTIIPHKEERFMITFLPVLYILTGFSFFYLISKIKNKKFRNYLIGLVILFVAINWSVQFKIDNGPAYYRYMRGYLQNPDIKGGIWVSNPVFAVDSDYKIDNIIYYPTFNHDKFINLKNNLNNAENILVNTCDLHCEPYNEFCKDDKKELIKLLKNSFNEVFYRKEGSCESYIFKK